MKIGYLRLNSDIKLSLDTTNSGQGIEHRRAFLNALISQGHDVTICSNLSASERPLLRMSGFSGTSWLAKLHYDMKTPLQAFDLILLEAGSSNPRFSRDVDPKLIDTSGEVGKPWVSKGKDLAVSILQYNIRRLLNYHGKIVLWHHIYIQTSMFPFKQNLKPSKVPIEQLSDINWRKVIDGVDFFKDREWTVVHHCLNEDAFKSLRSSRFGYSYNEIPNLKWRYVHLPKSKLDPYYPVNPTPKYDSLFIGSRQTNAASDPEYDRQPSVKKFYDTPLYKGVVLGHGYDKFQYAQPLETPTSSILVALSFWNNSYTHTFTESKAANTVGSMTGRTFLSLDSGATLLLDKSISGISKLGLSEYEVSSADEVKSHVDKLHSMSPERRDEVRKAQLATFPDWTDTSWVEVFA